MVALAGARKIATTAIQNAKAPVIRPSLNTSHLITAN